VKGYALPALSIRLRTKMGSVTPDNIVVRLGPEYGSATVAMIAGRPDFLSWLFV
jgi:hypothetical protein